MSSDQSILAVIGRWWLVMDPDDAPYSVRSTRSSAENYAANLGDGYTVVEVVSASQLRGAVEALRDIWRYADDGRGYRASDRAAQALVSLGVDPLTYGGQ